MRLPIVRQKPGSGRGAAALLPLIVASLLETAATEQQQHQHQQHHGRQHHQLSLSNRGGGGGGGGARALQAGTSLAEAKPSQTYMIPLPEDSLMKSFNRVNSQAQTGNPLVSMTSVSVSVSGTVIWYDHWEDGYDVDVTDASSRSSTTQVWGDGDPDNGCVEQIRARMENPPNLNFDCSTVTPGSGDVLGARETLILENAVPTVRPYENGPPYTELYYDGGDIVKTSFPSALARGGYPEDPGSVASGAVEILEEKLWGRSFRAPVGHPDDNAPSEDPQNAFEMAEYWIQAIEDGTTITVNDSPVLDSTTGLPITLDKGEEHAIKETVGTGDTITTNKKVQANILTGELGSTYEMRWYSLIPDEDWYHDYYTPAHSGDNSDPAKVVLFNPGTTTISVEHYDRDSGGDVRRVTTYSVPAGGSKISNSLGANDGSRFVTANGAEDKFYAMLVMDYDGSTGTGGNRHDWGHPLIPADKLTTQALIGLGYGCTSNDCSYDDDGDTRYYGAISKVWVTSTTDALLHVQYRDGTYHSTYGASGGNIDELEGVLLEQTSSSKQMDMTGAVVYATRRVESDPEPHLAVAWGQDPDEAETQSKEAYALDMGTVVMPLPETAANKFVGHAPDGDLDGDGEFSPGDILQYTIRVTNTGRVDLNPTVVNVVDHAAPLFEQTTYVAGSTKYTPEDSSGAALATEGIDDQVDPETPFPLDDSGVTNEYTLYVGTAHQYSFQVKIKDAADLTDDRVINTGEMRHNGVPKDAFEVETPLVFNPSIDIDATVMKDDGSSGASCPGEDLYTDVENTPLTYCYNITNTGDSFLDVTSLVDTIGSDFTNDLPVQLAPGESMMLSSPDALVGDDTDRAAVTANPVIPDGGGDLTGYDDVTDQDPAQVVMLLTTHPTSNPTSSPTTSPTFEPATAAPTSSPTDPGHDISNITACKGVNATLDRTTILRQFSFVAHTEGCVLAKVYVNTEGPITQDEIDSGMLDGRWELFCSANVYGMGSSEHTFFDKGHCNPYRAEVGVQQYFYVTMENRPEGDCGGFTYEAEFDIVSRTESIDNDVCPAIP